MDLCASFVLDILCVSTMSLSLGTKGVGKLVEAGLKSQVLSLRRENDRLRSKNKVLIRKNEAMASVLFQKETSMSAVLPSPVGPPTAKIDDVLCVGSDVLMFNDKYPFGYLYGVVTELLSEGFVDVSVGPSIIRIPRRFIMWVNPPHTCAHSVRGPIRIGYF